jgi:hypothetical protein
MQIYVQDSDGLIHTVVKAWTVGSDDSVTTTDTNERIAEGSTILVLTDPDPMPPPGGFARQEPSDQLPHARERVPRQASPRVRPVGADQLRRSTGLIRSALAFQG